MTSPRPVTPQDVPALSAVLARAFARDPFCCWMLRPDPAAYERWFEVALRRISLPLGDSWCDTARTACALWAPPGRWRMGLAQQAALVPALASAVGLWRVPAVSRGTSLIERHRPAEPHRYLFILGVDPAAQGAGTGGALVRHGLARCDAEGSPAYLETSQPRNVGWYERFGFRVCGELDLERGPHLWLMRRQPGQG